MKKLISTFTLILVTVWAYAATNFMDLAKAGSAKGSQWVQQFDKNTKQGGGYFKYFNELNTSIENIPGYQIKVAGTTTGYYRRVDALSNLNLSWLGAINDDTPATLQSLGWTQSAANAMWGTGTVDVTTDGYDMAALRYAYGVLPDLFDAVTINFENKWYYVNRTIEIEDTVGFIQTNGNFAYIWTTNSNTFSIFSRPQPANLAEAQTQLNAKFAWYNLNISAQGSQTCFKPGPSTSSLFVSLNTFNGDYGMVLEMTMDSKLIACENKNSLNGIYLKNDDCTGCDNANSNSNMTTIDNCRVYQEGSGNIAIRLDAVGGADIRNTTIEGTTYVYGIYVDGKNGTTTRGILIDNCWWECTTPAISCSDEAFIYVRDLAAGIVHVNGAMGQYEKVMVNAGNSSGLLTVIISNTRSWAPASGGTKWFYNATNCSWKINYNYQFDTSDHTVVPGTFCGTVPSYAAYGNNTYQYIPR